MDTPPAMGTAGGAPEPVLYATFVRRFQAFMWDGMIVFVCLIGLIIALSMVDLGRASRFILYGAVIALLVLYEPVLVAFAGGTLGQRLANLRVVAPTADGRLPFWKACVRSLLKTLTGVTSLATMPTNRRNQALHDLPFGTTVQIRDRTRASPHHYILERPAPQPHRLPSRLRRIAVILGYWVAIFVLFNVALTFGVSQECTLQTPCTIGQKFAAAVVSLAWLGGTVLLGVLGWQGRLPGARRMNV